MTLFVLFGNVVPAVQQKHRLQQEFRELLEKAKEEKARHQDVTAKIRAMKHDPYFVERLYVRAWNRTPHGAIELDEVGRVVHADTLVFAE